MIFLKLHTIEGTEFILNMNKVEKFESDGVGHTQFMYTDETFHRCRESFEEVEDMLHTALIGKAGVVSLEDVGAVVR